jgi:fluoride exporter
MRLLEWVALAAAGALGASARYLVDAAISSRSRVRVPLGTFAVNVTGSFLAGIVTGLALYHAFPATARLALGTGFCGAYTTFSTFTVETVRLVEAGAVAQAARNVVGTAVTCSLAAAAGLALAAL